MTKTAVKDRTKTVLTSGGITAAEICLWWLVRIFLVICAFTVDSAAKKIFIISASLSTFAVSVLRLLLPKSKFVKGISLHLQSCIAIWALLSAGIGYGLGLFETFPEYDVPLQFVSGIIGTAIGYYISVAMRKPQTKDEHTFTALFAFCISGTVTIFKKLTEFFIDFYTGRNLTKCEFVEDSHWLYRFFGFGMSPDAQRPLLDMDEDFSLSIIGSLIGMAVFYLYSRVKHKEVFVTQSSDIRDLFRNFSSRCKDKIRYEKDRLEAETSIFDVLFWWSVRVSMLYAFFVMEVRAEANLLLANLIGTFAVTLVHLLFPKESVLCRVSYKVQTYITAIVFLGSYVGNYVWAYGILPRYDLFLHLVSGTICVMGGYYVAVTLVEPKTRLDNALISGFAGAFSFFMMPAWEVSEFIGDFIWGTSNQGFYWGPSDSSFFFKVFGRGVGNTQLYYLFDTVYDVLLAIVTTVITFIALYAYLEYKRIKSAKNDYKTVTENQKVQS